MTLVTFGIITVFLVALTLTAVFLIRNDNNEKEKRRSLLIVQTPKKTKITTPVPQEIIPAVYETGYITSNHSTSNQCQKLLASDSMYPVQPQYVNYGAPFNFSNSDVNIFNAAP